MSTLTRKGYARIYCDKPESCHKVKEIIKQLDEFEFNYLPKDLIAPFSEYPRLVYTGKFDGLDMNLLTANCWAFGIYVWVLDNGQNEFLSNPKP